MNKATEADICVTERPIWCVDLCCRRLQDSPSVQCVSRWMDELDR